MLRRVAEAGLGGRVVVDSAGTHDYHIGKAPDPRTVRHAARRGYDLTHLRARQVQLPDFERFDLILAMDHEHLSHLVKMAQPNHAGKLQLFMDRAQGPRGCEVPDPYYGGPPDFERVLDLVEASIAGLIEDLSYASGQRRGN